MNFFEECHKCKPPKRKPGCHAKCKEYKEAKVKYAEAREAEKLRKDLLQYDKKYPNG